MSSSSSSSSSSLLSIATALGGDGTSLLSSGLPKFTTLESFRLTSAPHVLILCLNRPRQRNAIDAQMWREIGTAFSSLQEATSAAGLDIRCVLLVGNGRSFCSGIDIFDSTFGNGAFQGNDDDDDNKDGGVDVARRVLALRSQIVEMQQAFSRLETACSVPVVAAIHGACIGAGIDLISAADIRLASADALFSIREVQLGLAADVGTLQRFPKIVGFGSDVRRLCYTGNTFDATEAARMGFVSLPLASHVVELWQTALQHCREIATCSPVAVMGTKRSLLYSRDHASVEDGLQHIATHNAAALLTRDIPLAAMTATNKNPKTKKDPSRFSPLLPPARL